MSKPKKIKHKKRNKKMEVSKLTISPETMLKNTLDPVRKRELKFESVCAVIRSKPAGTKMKHSQLIPAAGYSSDKKSKSYRAGYSYIKHLVKTGKLVQEDFPHSTKHVWTIPGDSKVRITPTVTLEELKEKQDEEQPVNEDKAPEKPMLGEAGIDRIISNSNLEEKAKQFAWSKNSDSLREFIKWVHESEMARLW